MKGRAIVKRDPEGFTACEYEHQHISASHSQGPERLGMPYPDVKIAIYRDPMDSFELR